MNRAVMICGKSYYIMQKIKPVIAFTFILKYIKLQYFSLQNTQIAMSKFS